MNENRNCNFIKSLILNSKYVGNYKSNLNIINSVFYKIEKSEKKKFFFYSNDKIVNFKMNTKKISLNTIFKSISKKYDENFKFEYSGKKKIILDKNLIILGSNSSLAKMVLSLLDTEQKRSITFVYHNNKKLCLKIIKYYKIKNIKIIALKNFFKNLRFDNQDTIVFNFLTPNIFIQTKDFFSLKKFHEFLYAYLDININLINKMLLSKNKFKLFIPLTTYLDNKKPTYKEYYYSKQIIKNIIDTHIKQFSNIEVDIPKLNEFESKQTNSSLTKNKMEYEKIQKKIIKFIKT